MIDGQLIGAIIGASAAVCAQIVASFIQFMHNRAQLDLAKEQLRLSARQSFIDRKFEAIAHLLENMQALLDNDIDAREAYLKIRHQRFLSILKLMLPSRPLSALTLEKISLARARILLLVLIACSSF